MAQRNIEVAFPPKNPIHCHYSAANLEHLHSTSPTLIFTHGAGGTLQADAIVNFVNGFVSTPENPTILCLQGNMNLKSRVKMFTAVIDAGSTEPEIEVTTTARCLGGRSMGARAAIMAATDETTHLVLVSYPLHTDKEVRDKILLDLLENMKVVFVSGDHDSMCDLKRLEGVRKEMRCKTWRVVVQAADHGMNVKPKAATKAMGEATGTVVADWLASCDDNLREGKVAWDAEKEIAQWSGWSSTAQDVELHEDQLKEIAPSKAPKARSKAQQKKDKPEEKAASRKRGNGAVEVSEREDVTSTTRQRRKA